MNDFWVACVFLALLFSPCVAAWHGQVESAAGQRFEKRGKWRLRIR